MHATGVQPVFAAAVAWQLRKLRRVASHHGLHAVGQLQDLL